MHQKPAFERDVATAAPIGALELASARELSSRLAEMAGEAGRHAVLDLTRISFMDSVGLGVVLKAANRFQRQGKQLVIVVPPGPVRRMLDFAGVSDRLSLVERRDQVAGALAV